ncbi:hypothetical protein [Pseudonocardia broussonetiae]|uniref:Uncharacterized protein n=1 Tax=Pseudonocardia broussonetiae TaxID=2736640 RepID=A0A6M6JN25_9PSEU|nr:hypothetical protein [Pseudonocardia broussonetiae]QJY47839.1 hypothetical protein HOP40_20175 [Pseudonocardia broussonetiae]
MFRSTRPPDSLRTGGTAPDPIFSGGRFGARKRSSPLAGTQRPRRPRRRPRPRSHGNGWQPSNPGAILFVEKITILKARDEIEELPAVAQGRFLNLPYALWTSGPLNIDAAERGRRALEGWRPAPVSTIVQAHFDDRSPA